MIRKFQRQDLEAAVKIWLAANKEAHDFIDPCYWEGYKDAVKEMFLQAEIYVFETEDMMEEIFDETGGILGFIGLDKDYVEGIFVRGDVRSQSIGKQLLDFVKQKRKRLELNVYVKNKRAVQFYEREGFCIQREGKQVIVVNPPFPPMTEAEIDASYDLPYTRLPHPKYKGKVIPAFEMIKFSVNIHRGCFGGCAFCTISAHQGKFIASRSKESILKEVKAITEMPDFKGYLSDLGGPSANMYRMKGKDERICAKCKKPSCISPVVCKNLNADHTPLLDIYKAVDRLPGIKKSFIGSGVRYDLLLHRYADESLNKAAQTYTEELIARHVSGRLKVAPEHTQDEVLKQMRKPSFSQFGQFKKIFDKVNRQYGLNQQLIPYFISSHPGCTEADMAELAVITKSLHFQLEQVQDFTPTPMTLATEMYYTGYHPYTLEKVYTARSKEQKLAQRQFFFWYKPESRRQIMQVLQKMGRKDLIEKLFGRNGGTNPAPRKRR